MPARLISIPFLLSTALFAYLALEVDEQYSLYIVASVIVLAIIYTLSPQINWWWYRKHPPEIDAPMRKLLVDNHAFYNDLSVAEKQTFRHRMALYKMAVEFIPKGWEQIPEDVKGVIAANVVQMTFRKEDFLLPKFERIVVYKLPFPSPQFPEVLHASEVFEEDGVFLFSAQQVMWSFAQPSTYYNLVLHEYVNAFRLSYPSLDYPIETTIEWSLLERISGFKKEQIEGIINLPNQSKTTVSGVLFFTHGSTFQRLAPKLYQKWETIFGGENRTIL
ncbi:MAG: zinc-dependent peptidase [Bacteroidota bacterium]